MDVRTIEYVESIIAEANRRAAASTMAIGEFQDKLHKSIIEGPADMPVCIYLRIDAGEYRDLMPCKYEGDMYFGSYRGYYSHLALGHTILSDEGITGQSLLMHMLRNSVVSGFEMTGYKGGEFVTTPETPVWIANCGDCPQWAIYDVGVERLDPNNPRIIITAEELKEGDEA